MRSSFFLYLVLKYMSVSKAKFSANETAAFLIKYSKGTIMIY